MKIHFVESQYWNELEPNFQIDYARRVTDAYAEAAELLPTLSNHVNYIVQPREYDLIEETQDSGYTENSELILLGFHPQPRLGLDSILNHIRATVFHESNHAARFTTGEWHETLLQQAIMEGLATVFERDNAGAEPLWGMYQNEDIEAWLREIQEPDTTAQMKDYLYLHPDGRKWIVYKVGTYIVDKAIEYSGKTISELTPLPCDEILKFAKIREKPDGTK